MAKVIKTAPHLGEAYIFECPGCGENHMPVVAYSKEYSERSGRTGPVWQFNGDVNRPTFTPSVIVRGKKPLTDDELERVMAGEKIQTPSTVCHFFITEGKIQFLGDCTHALSGKTVELPDIE